MIGSCSSLLVVLFLAFPEPNTGCKKVLEFTVTEDTKLKPEEVNADYITGYPIPGKPVRIIVNAKDLEDVLRTLEAASIEPTVVKDNLNEILEQIRPKPTLQRLASGHIDWKRFWRVNDIHGFLDNLASANPDVAKVISIGKSTEGRDLKLIKIGFPGEEDCQKPSYFIDGGMHAREWAGVASTTYIINELVTKKNEHRNLLENMDFYIVPVMNPDGYEFTHTGSRLWRKTRSRHNPSDECIGVDGNRNFDYKFGFAGTSNQTCSEIYKGPHAFSEPETKAMKDFIMSNQNAADWRIYSAIHSYGQVILYPWGYSKTDKLTDEDALKTCGMKAAEAIKKVHGQIYEVGGAAALLGEGAGGSDDWAKGSGVFQYSYTLEVRPGRPDSGNFSLPFLLPEEQILPCAEEVSAGVLAMAKWVALEDPDRPKNRCETGEHSTGVETSSKEVDEDTNQRRRGESVVAPSYKTDCTEEVTTDSAAVDCDD